MTRPTGRILVTAGPEAPRGLKLLYRGEIVAADDAGTALYVSARYETEREAVEDARAAATRLDVEIVGA